MTKTTKKTNCRAIKQWQERCGLNDASAAKLLGLARNTFVKHRDGPTPLTTRLALSAILAGLKPA